MSGVHGVFYCIWISKTRSQKLHSGKMHWKGKYTKTNDLNSKVYRQRNAFLQLIFLHSLIANIMQLVYPYLEIFYLLWPDIQTLMLIAPFKCQVFNRLLNISQLIEKSWFVKKWEPTANYGCNFFYSMPRYGNWCSFVLLFLTQWQII